MGEIEARLYDLNKSLMGQMKAFDIERARELITGYFMELYQLDVLNENYMLLAAEERDFTVFRFARIELEFDKMANEIIDTLESRGIVKDVTIQEDRTMDIWVDDKFYKLFDYDWGVIEV